MDKYNKYLNTTEVVSRNKEYKKIKLILLKFKRYITKYKDKENINKLLKMDYDNLFKVILVNYSLYNEELQNYIKENIFNKLNKESIINYYLIIICYFNTVKDNDNINKTINSFKKSGLIKDIIYDDKNKRYVLTTIDNKTIEFQSKIDDENDIVEANANCHSICNFIAKQNKELDLYICTILLDNLVGEKCYHTFIVYENTVNDFAHNIIMNFDDYKELYNPTIITFENAQKVHEEIEEIKIQDSEFDNGNAELLNYAIYKQLNKNNKRLIRK